MLQRMKQGWREMSTLRKIRRVFMLTLLAIGIWAITPYFYSRKVSEDFPTSQPQPAAAVQVTQPQTAGVAQALLRGSFTRVDVLHAAEGFATIYKLSDGKLALRFENFRSTNGPDLFVGLSAHPQPRSRGEALDQGYEEIQMLKANEGDQNYDLPAGIDLSRFKSVVIYCRTFSLVFSSAELTASS